MGQLLKIKYRLGEVEREAGEEGNADVVKPPVHLGIEHEGGIESRAEATAGD